MEILVSRGLFLLGLAALAVPGHAWQGTSHECERELGDCPQDNSFIQMQLSLASVDSIDSKDSEEETHSESPKHGPEKDENNTEDENKERALKAAETAKEFVKEKAFKAAETAKEFVKEKAFKAAATPKEFVKEKAKEFKAAARAKEFVKEKAEERAEAFKEKAKEFKAAARAKEFVKEKAEERAEERAEAFKEKAEAFKEKAEAFKAAATAKKLVKATEQAGEAKNLIVVDDRNFTQLKDDLSYAGDNLAVAKDLSDTFEQAVVRSTLAQHEVVQAEAERQAILKRIHKLLNKTIALEAMTKDDLILELKSFNVSGVQSQTASAAEMAAEAAKLAQDLSSCEARIVEALGRRDAAMTQQAEAVKQIQQNLRSSIMVEMNDTRLVQILDASDRSQMVPVMTTTTTTNTVLQDILDRLEVTVNVKTEGEATKETAAEGEVLYPTDWAVIGALVLVIVFVTAIVCYSRTQER